METPSSTKQPFTVKVDSDHKATEFRPFSVAPPHMLSFHLAWFSLFSCCFSTFAVASLLPVIRDDLNLTDADISHAGTVTFLGSIFSRLAMGPACDLFGPRLTSATVSLITASILFMAPFISSPQSFTLFRFLVGLSLANFVANQFWMSSMFSGRVVGLANAFSGGWANTGSGVTQLVLPMVYTLIVNYGFLPSTAWRITLFFPATLQVLTALLVLICGQDTPDKKYYRPVYGPRKERKTGQLLEVLEGLKNYRGWILGLIYGCCFGVELTIDNIIAQYFYDRFGLDIQVAGAVAATFGLANLVSRPVGGWFSDWMGERFGMRGRLWGLWGAQMVAGLLCVLLGRVNSLLGSLLVMFGFSFFVQAAAGLTFGVVPFVSKSFGSRFAKLFLLSFVDVIYVYDGKLRREAVERSLGVISGMTGSGGAVGAVIAQLLLFSGSKFSRQAGISLMGLMMIVCTQAITLIYFSQWGGMFCGPSSDLTSYDGADYSLLA
ncbi:Major facilitator superfamily [Dillenia turbinata]|uniref:Major facilitator superfamily n=1 Tax=Dillenia turbinata TaxID=194707 RepID=A0AAN8VBA7_9MAGN